MNITLIAGARPNFMKIAPLIKAIEQFNEQKVESGKMKVENSELFHFHLCQHDLFAPQTVRTASVLRLTYAAHADEALLSTFTFLFILFYSLILTPRYAIAPSTGAYIIVGSNVFDQGLLADMIAFSCVQPVRFSPPRYISKCLNLRVA